MQTKAEKFIKTLGEIVKRHRKLSGKSVYKISAECAIPRTTWRRIENGIHKDVNLTSIWKISDGLDILPEVLIKELREELGEKFNFDDELQNDNKKS